MHYANHLTLHSKKNMILHQSDMVIPEVAYVCIVILLVIFINNLLNNVWNECHLLYNISVILPSFDDMTSFFAQYKTKKVG